MIELRHVRKEFEDCVPLEDINLVINSGDVISIIGPSGTGKSTLLRCINMLEPPTSGEIIVNGQVITDKNCDINEVRKKMGMVFQSFNLFGHLTVIENIMNPQITLLGRERQEAYDKAMDLLHKVGLGSKALNYPDELSGGQQQRVAIARTLAMDPDIILFDEPTSALDPSMIGEVQSVIRMLANTGVTMILVTHEMDFAKKISNRVIFLADGEVYEDGTPKQIFNNPQKEKTKRFIHRLSSLAYKIDSADYDFDEIKTELVTYSEKLLIENERMSKLQIALEAMVVNNLLEINDDPHILVKIDYSEKLDTLTMDILYTGEHFSPSESSNDLFKSVLAEDTTEYKDEILDIPEDIYTNKIHFKFGWKEEE